MNAPTSLLIASTLLACSSAPRPTPTPDLPRGSLAPMFAPLFEDGRKFVFDWTLEGELGQWDDSDREWPRSVSVRLECVVEVEGGSGKLLQANLVCAPDELDVPAQFRQYMATTWLGNERGLWWFGRVDIEDEAEVDRLLEHPPQLASAPVATDDNTVVQDGNAWCRRDEYGGDDYSAWCFEAGRGLVYMEDRDDSDPEQAITQRFVLVR